MLQARHVSDKHKRQEEVLADKLNNQEIDINDVDTETAEHPEGRKRGGVVAVYKDGTYLVFFDEIAEEWVPYNN